MPTINCALAGASDSKPLSTLAHALTAPANSTAQTGKICLIGNLSYFTLLLNSTLFYSERFRLFLRARLALSNNAVVAAPSNALMGNASPPTIHGGSL